MSLTTGIKTIEDIAINGRKVLLRVDLNVPLKDGVITSDARIRAVLPTIKLLLDKGAALTLCAHLGRPKGKRKMAFSLEPVALRLAELLELDVILADDCIGDGVKNLARESRPGSLMLLENLRFHSAETKNEFSFARALAEPFDVYINDAFGASHRTHASIVGVAEHVQDAVIGILLEQELAALDRVLTAPKKPFVAIVGGAKVSDKLGVLEAMAIKADVVCIGGAMAYTFLQVTGTQIGKSRVEKSMFSQARSFFDTASAHDTTVILPVDHVAATEFDIDATAQLIAGADIPADSIALDIGPKTRAAMVAHIEQAATILWNGPMGVFEFPSFAAGTHAVAHAVAASSAYSVVGGGDSIAAIEAVGCAEDIDHLSTGGGASLDLIKNGTLPGLEALRNQ